MYNSTYGIRTTWWFKPYDFAMKRVTLFVNLFGVFCNIPVLIIFFKDGFASNTNICFLSLAIVDLFVSAFLTIQKTWSMCYELGIAKDSWSSWQLNYNIAAALSDAMNCVSSWITALITLERLLCILFPLKVSCKNCSNFCLSTRPAIPSDHLMSTCPCRNLSKNFRALTISSASFRDLFHRQLEHILLFITQFFIVRKMKVNS